MSRKTNGCVEKAFLIVVRDVVVGQDLAQTITDDRPKARVIISPSLEEAVTALRDVSAVEMAFVAADPGVFEHSALADALRRGAAKWCSWGCGRIVRRRARCAGRHCLSPSPPLTCAG